jgi:hypothetical protein
MQMGPYRVLHCNGYGIAVFEILSPLCFYCRRFASFLHFFFFYSPRVSYFFIVRSILLNDAAYSAQWAIKLLTFFFDILSHCR